MEVTIPGRNIKIIECTDIMSAVRSLRFYGIDLGREMLSFNVILSPRDVYYLYHWAKQDF